MGTLSDAELKREQEYERRLAAHRERDKAYRMENGLPVGYRADEPVRHFVTGQHGEVASPSDKMQAPHPNKAVRPAENKLDELSLEELEARAAALGITVETSDGSAPTKADYVRALSA